MIHIFRTDADRSETASAYERLFQSFSPNTITLTREHLKRSLLDFGKRKQALRQLTTDIKQEEPVIFFDAQSLLNGGPLLSEHARLYHLVSEVFPEDTRHKVKLFYKKAPVQTIYLSRALAKNFEELEGFVQQSHIVYPPFFPEHHSNEEKQSQNFLIGCARPFEKGQGIETVIRAFHQLIEVLPQLQLILVGDGSEKGRLQWLVSHLRLQRRVQFVTASKAYRKFISHFDILICPGEHPIHWDMDLVSAWDSGVPVIAAKQGIYEELIQNGETGLLFEPGNAHMLSQQLLNLYNHPEWRKHYHVSGKNIAAQTFTAEQIKHQIHSLLF